MSGKMFEKLAALLVVSAIVIGTAGAAAAADCKWEPYRKSRPWLSGERYEATVPDTLDVAYQGELALNNITGFVDVDDPANGELWIAAFFCSNPPYMMHAFGVAGCHNAKVAEPIAGLRVMTGSAANQCVEKKMVDWLIRGLSKDDGLLYALARPDRPWYTHDCEIALRQNSPQSATPTAGAEIVNGNQDYAWIYAQVRMLKFMMAYYQYSRDPAWKTRIDKMIQGIDKKMARHAVDPATGKKYAYMPSGGGINPTYGSCMPRSGWGEGAHEPASEGESANEGSVFMDIGPYPGVLAQWYQMSGNRRALELAHEFANFMMMKKFWGTDKDPLGRERGAELGHWEGHYFGRVEALKGLLDYAIITNNAAIKEFVRGAYDWARNAALWPSLNNPKTVIPAIGFFDPHCGCATPRMLALAIKLSEAGIGDYWDDADRFIRNHIAENQLRDPELVRGILKTKTQESILRPLIDSTDRIVERNIGGVPVHATPTEILLPTFTITGTCCICHIGWGFYYAWDAITRHDNGVATVNLLLNRASPWMDIDSYLPYEGKVVIHNKTAKTLLLRIPTWADKKAVKCSRNGKAVDFAWVGHYIVVDGLRKKDTVTVEFPMVEWTEKHYQYTFTFRGNTVVDVSPRESTGGYPIYVRDHLKGDKAPMKKVTRYVSPRLVKW